MTMFPTPAHTTTALVIAISSFFSIDGLAATPPPAKAASAASVAKAPAALASAPKPSRKGKGTPKTKVPAVPERPVALVLPEASEAQVDAAGRVYYGTYECEFQQSILIEADPTFPSYVDVRHGKSMWIMKPVLSSTGAIRLEDVMADTLMVQIASKSMLLNVNTGHRLVDDCVSPAQRLAIEANRLAKLQEAADATAASASGAASTPSRKGLLSDQ